MTDIVLHHSATSPYAEKMRLALGMKGLNWLSVEQPRILPKPELVALTGGYRRIPVLQIGADIWCETSLILLQIERRFPQPSFFNCGMMSARAINQWGDALMADAVPLVFGEIGDGLDPAFIADRSAMASRPFDIGALKAMRPRALAGFRAGLQVLEDALADGRPFLEGDRPGIADAGAIESLWLARFSKAPCAALIDRYAHVARWEPRVAAIGHGARVELSREAALDLAKGAEPMRGAAVDPDNAEGLGQGDKITVVGNDFGHEVTTGALQSLDDREMAVLRFDPRVGEVAVHYPRAGYSLKRA